MDRAPTLVTASIQGTYSNICTLVLTRYIHKPKVRKEHNLFESKKEGEVKEPEPVDVSSLYLAV
jgi:hypothetical protein